MSGETVDVGYVHVLAEPGGECVEDCPHPMHLVQGVWKRTEEIDGETQLESSVNVGEPNADGNYVVDPWTVARLLREAGYARA